MPTQQDPDRIEPAAPWLARVADIFRFAGRADDAPHADIGLALRTLGMVEIDDLPIPVIERDAHLGVSLTWELHDPRISSSRGLTITVHDDRIRFTRRFEGGPVPIAASLLAKGSPMTARELFRWLYGPAVVLTYGEMIKGRRGGGGR